VKRSGASVVVSLLAVTLKGYVHENY
jgi:hypothetical protein